MKRVLLKVLTNILAALLILVYFGNIIAGQFSGQINSFLGISTSMIVPIDGAEDDNTYMRYYESTYKSVAE